MYSNWKLTLWATSLLILSAFNMGCQQEVDARPMAPDFSLSDLSGNVITLKQYRGQVVLLDFWATWCAPCRMSIPELANLHEKYEDRGLVILGISIDDPSQAPDAYIKSFQENLKINYTVLRFNNKVIADYFRNESMAIPTLFVIDREGMIRDKFVGFNPGVLEKSVVGLLK